MNINFKVSKPYLIARIINKKDSSLLNNKDLENLRYQVEDLNFPEYLKSKVNEIESSEEFKTLYKENIHYMENVKNYYENKKVFIEEYLKRILKLDLNNIKMTAYISHPSFKSGLNIGNNIFIFGHHKGLNDNNYNLIYLIHETLHSVLSYELYSPAAKLYKDMKENNMWDEYYNNLPQDQKEEYNNAWTLEQKIIHAIIELITDNELYTILNGESKYNEGHENLIETKKKLYLYWFSYLGMSYEEILKRIGSDINMKDFDYERIKNAKDIREFIDICIEDLTLDSVNAVNKL